MRFENGEQINMESIIEQTMKAEQHVWVILIEDLSDNWFNFIMSVTEKVPDDLISILLLPLEKRTYNNLRVVVSFMQQLEFV